MNTIIQETIENGLENLKRDELILLCEELDIPTSGTKATLKHRIYACYDAVLEHERKPDKSINFDFGDVRMLDYIAKSKINVIVARAIIRRIACACSDENGNVKFDGYQACFEIVKSGWKDEILSDVEQDIFITLYELFEKNYLAIENGFIYDFQYCTGTTIFKDYENTVFGIGEKYITLFKHPSYIKLFRNVCLFLDTAKIKYRVIELRLSDAHDIFGLIDGKQITVSDVAELMKKRFKKGVQAERIDYSSDLEICDTMRSIWSDLYASVQRTFATFKTADTSRAKKGNYVIVTGKNDKEMLLGENSSSYQNALIDMCNIPDDVQSFLSKYSDVSEIEFSASLERFLKDFGVKYPQHKDTSKTCISMILSGYKKGEIADFLGKTRRSIECLFLLMKTFYHVWDGQLVTLRTSDKREFGCTYMDNDSSVYGSYEFKYGYLPNVNSCDGITFADMFGNIPAKTDFEIHCIKRYMYEHVLFVD